jgi:RND family efflux transporter MFP subunit
MKYKILFSLPFLISIILSCGDDSANQYSSQTSSIEDQKAAVPVEVQTIGEKVMEQTLDLTGILIPENSVDLVAEVSGKVIKIYKELGDYVNRDQTLALIDDVVAESGLVQAKAQVLSTESSLAIAEANLKSDEILFENNDISEFEYDNSKLSYKTAEAQYLTALAALDAAQKTFDDTRIKTPISGFISRKNIDFGSMVTMGSVVFRIVDLSSLKLRTSVPQEVINRVKVGGKAAVLVSALNNRSFPGKVKRISPQADEITGGFPVEIEVENKDNSIKAGMTAKIEMLLSKQESVLAVPEYAVVSKGEENYVYKIDGTYAELVRIELGESVGQNIIVEKGLNVGDRIVIVGMKNLGTRTKVNIEKTN